MNLPTILGINRTQDGMKYYANGCFLNCHASHPMTPRYIIIKNTPVSNPLQLSSYQV